MNNIFECTHREQADILRPAPAGAVAGECVVCRHEIRPTRDHTLTLRDGTHPLIIHNYECAACGRSCCRSCVSISNSPFRPHVVCVDCVVADGIIRDLLNEEDD
jgi:hypothetical protein